MSQAIYKYVVSQKHITHNTTVGNDFVCNKCRKEIKLGQSVISKNRRRKSKQKFYHSICAELVNLI